MTATPARTIRNLCDWSFRRLALVWIIAMVFQFLLIGFSGSLVRSSRARPLGRVGSLKVDARPPSSPAGVQKLAPSRRATYVTSAGDSIYEMITVARADSEAKGIRRVPRGFGYYFFIFAVAGTIPLGLLILTAVWSFGQLMKKFTPALFSAESATPAPD